MKPRYVPTYISPMTYANTHTHTHVHTMGNRCLILTLEKAQIDTKACIKQITLHMTNPINYAIVGVTYVHIYFETSKNDLTLLFIL